MKLRIVPASSGLNWMRQGLQVLRRQPMNFMGLVGMLIGAALLLATLPLLGPLLVVGVMPVVWMGFMLATRRTILGERVTPGVLIEAVRAPDTPRKTFLQLGGAYIAAVQLMMLLASAVGPGAEAVADAMAAMQDSAEMVVSPVVLEDMLWRMALLMPVSLVFWHTPALVLWARMPVGKALFFSAVATWRNLGAFVIYIILAPHGAAEKGKYPGKRIADSRLPAVGYRERTRRICAHKLHLALYSGADAGAAEIILLALYLEE